MRASLPYFLRTFISTNVEIRAGEQGAHLSEDAVQHFKHHFLARTEHHRKSSPPAHHLVFLACARQFRISGYGCQAVSGYVYFGDDGDETFACIFYYFPDVVLRVIAGIFLAIFINAPGADFRKQGIFLDFHPPALVVAEVEMQCIDFDGGQHVYVFLQSFYGNEVAGYVEHQTTIGKARTVCHLHFRSCPLHTVHAFRRLYLGRQQLQERAHAVKQAAQGGSTYLHSVFGHAKLVSLISRHGFIDGQTDGPVFFLRKSETGRCTHFLCIERSHRL